MNTKKNNKLMRYLISIAISGAILLSAITINTIPVHASSFNKNYPSNGATVYGTSITLSWSAANNAWKYFFCISPDVVTPSSPCNLQDKSTWHVPSGGFTATSATVTGLTGGQTYQWQVGVKLNDNNFIYADSDISAVWSFTVARILTISGNTGLAGVPLSYTDGTAKTAVTDGNGNYSFTVSYNWSGTVTPSLICYTFTPSSRSYTNLTTDQSGQNYLYTIVNSPSCANANVAIAGASSGIYGIPSKGGLRVSYAGVNNGPIQVNSSNSVPIIASERVAYSPNGGTTWTSYSEWLGLPSSQLTTSYALPWYNNVDLNTQLRFGNVGNANTTVTVTVGGVVKGTYLLYPNQSARVSYASLSDGPVLIESSGGVPIIASERVAYSPNGGATWTSYSEWMGLPSAQLTTSYAMPWYNNVDLNTQLRFGNVGNADTTVTVTIGGTMVGTYPVSPNQSVRVSYPNINSGPVLIESSGGIPIITSERVAYTPDSGTTWASYSEWLGLPSSQLTTSYVMTWYNNVDLNTQLRFGNVGNADTTVTVNIGGTVVGTYALSPNQSVRVSYPGINYGPVQIQSSSGVPIIASERVAYTPNGGGTWTSYSEWLGLPSSLLTTSYAMPWYNNVDLNTQLRFSVP